MDVLPFRLVGESDRRVLADALAGAVRDWAEEWFVSDSLPSVSVHGDDRMVPPMDEEWLVVDDGIGDGWFAWHLDEGAWPAFTALLFGANLEASLAPSPIMRSVLHESVRDLAIRLRGRGGLPGCASPLASRSLASVRCGYGSGAIFCELAGSFPRQQLAVGGAVVEAVVGPRRLVSPPAKELASRLSAIGDSGIALEVVLGSVELRLGELADVAVGDVILVETSCRDPLQIRTPDGRHVASAHLGRLGERKAIQVICK